MGTFSIWHWIIVIIIFYLIYKKMRNKKNNELNYSKSKIIKDTTIETFDEKKFRKKVDSLKNPIKAKSDNEVEIERDRILSMKKIDLSLREKKEFFEEKLHEMREQYKKNGILLVKFSDYIYLNKNSDGYLDKMSFSLSFHNNQTRGLITDTNQNFNNKIIRDRDKEFTKDISNHITSFDFSISKVNFSYLFQCDAEEIVLLKDLPELPNRLKTNIHFESDNFDDVRDKFEKNYLAIILEQCCT